MSRLVYSSTDEERLKILQALNEFCKNSELEEPVLPEDKILKVEKYFAIFDKLKAYQKFVQEEQQKQNKEFQDLFEKARIFVLHYYKSIFMAIERGELPASISNYYGLVYPFEIPQISDGTELLSVSEKLFNADNMRVGSGGKYFANPSIGAVKVWVEKFKEVWEAKTNKFNVKKGEVENIENIRRDADKFIAEIHNFFDKRFSEYKFEKQVQLFEELGMQVEPGQNMFEESTEPIDIFLPEKDLENVNEKKSNSGTNGINQLRFDLFFPEA
ncbi:MAG TPA: hypothetical protein PLL66_04355 [Bacteroidales bacterium]|nr:hypothetical protein [Bacteroidales bacterium]